MGQADTKLKYKEYRQHRHTRLFHEKAVTVELPGKEMRFTSIQTPGSLFVNWGVKLAVLIAIALLKKLIWENAGGSFGSSFFFTTDTTSLLQHIFMAAAIILFDTVYAPALFFFSHKWIRYDKPNPNNNAAVHNKQYLHAFADWTWIKTWQRSSNATKTLPGYQPGEHYLIKSVMLMLFYMCFRVALDGSLRISFREAFGWDYGEVLYMTILYPVLIWVSWILSEFFSGVIMWAANLKAINTTKQ